MASRADVLRLLRSRPGIPAAELAAGLGVSPSRLSRLLGEVGEAVRRFGRARATRYALARTIQDVGVSAPIHEVGVDGTPSEAGRLSFLEPDGFWLAYEGEEGLQQHPPMFLKEGGPSGFLGRQFSAWNPELGLPSRLEAWRVEDYVRALALRGEDAVGNLIVGTESLARFLRLEERPNEPREYPELARSTAAKMRPSSAGGDRPKFTAFVGGRHVLVKFAPPGESDEGRRWRDLLLCEHVALDVIRDAGVAPAAASRVLDIQGWRFLEVTRFDRVGPRGRVGVRSLEAVKIDEMISARGWTAAVDALASGVRPRIRPEDARRVRWLDAFGSLSGNSDRHDGNLSFLRDASGALSLAPAYDTAPMALAPVAAGVLDDSWVPEPPLPTALAEWQLAVPAALGYWAQLSRERRLDAQLRQRAREGRSAVEHLASRLFPQLRIRGGSER
jgi:hypothetical protein